MTEKGAGVDREALLRRKEELQYLGTQFALHGGEVPGELVEELAAVEAALTAQGARRRAPEPGEGGPEPH